MSPFELARLNLVRRKISTLIAITAIALSVALGGVLYRVFDLTNQRFASLAGGGTSLVGAKAGGIEILLGALNAEGDFPGFIPYALYDTLKAGSIRTSDGMAPTADGMELIVPMLYSGKFAGFRVLGTDGNFLDRPYGDDSVAVSQGKWFEGDREIVVGAHVAEKLKLRVGQDIDVSGWSLKGVTESTVRFKVAGVLRESDRVWDRMLFTSVEDAQALVFENPDAMASSIWGARVLSYFWVFQGGESARVMSDLINKRSVAQFISIYEQKTRLRELTATGEEIAWVVMGFIVLLGALSVTAILITRFDSMHLQIAVLRAIGYQKSAISKWMLLEGLLLGSVAVLVGATLDFAIFPLAKDALGKTLPPETIISNDIWLAWPIWAAAIVSTVLATVVPLYRTYRQDVHSSLKTV